MAFLSETEFEQTLPAQLQALGDGIARKTDIGPDGRLPERESYSEVLLQKRLQAAVARLNPGLPDEARQDGAAGVEIAAACVAGRKRPPVPANDRRALLGRGGNCQGFLGSSNRGQTPDVAMPVRLPIASGFCPVIWRNVSHKAYV